MTSTYGVLASCNLPADIATGSESLETILKALQTEDKMGTTCTAMESHQVLSFLQIDADMKPIEWPHALRHLMLADDCHSCNLVLRGSTNGTSRRLRLSTTRPIAQGKPISLWFGPDLLAAIRMPFLTPANIKGEKNYTCHKCNRTYEYPNPLKMHLTLNDCKEKVSLINILSKLLSSTKTNKNTLQRDLNDRLEGTKGKSLIISNVPSFGRRLDQIDASSLTTAVDCRTTITQSTAVSHRSAFTPYRQRTESRDIHSPLHLTMPPPVTQLPLFPCDLSSATSRRFNNSQESLLVLPLMSSEMATLSKSCDDIHNLTEQRAVDMETFVSNLGKLKHGHLCLYCGKVYSRKYGLKIHIRTHTGFKPLKCKYCLRPFGDPSNLNKHVRLHAQGETPYRCDLCGKILVRRRDLERHMKSRHQTDLDTISNHTIQENSNKLSIKL